MTGTPFPYDRRGFVFITFLLLTVSALLLGFSSILGVQLWWLLLLAVVLGIVTLSYGITPLLTSHHLDDNSLTLYQGIFFKGKIPLSNIQGFERIEKGPWRTGVFFQLVRHSLYVTSRRYDLLTVHLKQPQRFGMVFGKKVDTVIFDVTDTNAFLEAMKLKGL